MTTMLPAYPAFGRPELDFNAPLGFDYSFPPPSWSVNNHSSNYFTAQYSSYPISTTTTTTATTTSDIPVSATTSPDYYYLPSPNVGIQHQHQHQHPTAATTPNESSTHLQGAAYPCNCASCFYATSAPELGMHSTIRFSQSPGTSVEYPTRSGGPSPVNAGNTNSSNNYFFLQSSPTNPNSANNHYLKEIDLTIDTAPSPIPSQPLTVLPPPQVTTVIRIPPREDLSPSPCSSPSLPSSPSEPATRPPISSQKGEMTTKPVLLKTAKKRVIWTKSLHKLFLAALKKLGENAKPRKVWAFMQVPGLTRENVASHLQKYKLRVSREKQIEEIEERELSASGGSTLYSL